jgi:hypothetical protein
MFSSFLPVVFSCFRGQVSWDLSRLPCLVLYYGDRSCFGVPYGRGVHLQDEANWRDCLPRLGKIDTNPNYGCDTEVMLCEMFTEF